MMGHQMRYNNYMLILISWFPRITYKNYIKNDTVCTTFEEVERQKPIERSMSRVENK